MRVARVDLLLASLYHADLVQQGCWLQREALRMAKGCC